MSRFTKTKMNKSVFDRGLIFGRITFGSFAFNLLLSGLTVAVLLFNLNQMNQMSTYGFKIRELEKEADVLTQENKKLSLETAKLESISRVEEIGKKFNLVKINTTNYIVSMDSPMASR